jgi:hypothetical protein
MKWLELIKRILSYSCFASLFCTACRSYAPASELALGKIDLAPVFVLPDCDRQNGIEKVYFKQQSGTTDEVIEVTVVFKDEDQPFFLFDGVYDLFRCFRYHRKKDIETFYLHAASSDHSLMAIDFGDAYSGGQKFNKGLVTHFHRVIRKEQLEMQEGRPVVYINTWNHLFSEKDNNPERPKLTYSIYASFKGTRGDAEPQRKKRK